MRIVLLNDRIPPENVGGAGRVAWSLALGLHRAGHEVHVIAATKGQPFEQVREGIPTYHLHARYPERFQHWLNVYNPQTVGALQKLLARLRPDVLNAHNIHHDLSFYSLTTARRLGIPTVFTAHDLMTVAYGKLTHFINPAQRAIPTHVDYRLPAGYNARQMRLRFNPFRNLLIRRILTRDALRRTCVSQAQRQALAANGLGGFEVVYNGVEVALYDDISSAEISAYRASFADRPTVLFAGRLTREKGSPQLLAAFERVIQTVPSAMLLLLTPPTASAANRLIAEHPALTGAIHYGGWLAGRDLITAFRTADVIAAPSLALETLGMVAIEGMAAAKPALVSCFGGLPEVVLDGQTGYVVNPLDVAAMADRLIGLLRDPALARRMGAAGRRRVLETFTLDQQVSAMEKIYGEVEC